MAESELYNTTAPSFSGIEPASWNYSKPILPDLPMDSNFIWLLCSLVSAISWIIYIAYYNSRVIGYIVTRLLNRFVIREGYVKVGESNKLFINIRYSTRSGTIFGPTKIRSIFKEGVSLHSQSKLRFGVYLE